MSDCYSQRQRYLCLFFSLISLLISHVAKPQQPLQDSADVKNSIDNFLNDYQKKVGHNLPIYNGREYISNGQKARGFAFYESDDFIVGSIYYDGILYKNIKMRYDLVLDELVINDFASTNQIALVKEKIDYFNLGVRHFVLVSPEKSSSDILKTGFYEQLYGGYATVLARREKKLIFPSRADDETKYVEHDFYFMKIKNVYYKIESGHSVLKIMKDKKDLIQKFIKENNISFKDNPEEAYAKTAEYYSKLMN